MIQEIIVYIIFAIAAFITIWKLIKSFIPKNLPSSGGCTDCSGCSCSIKELKQNNQ